MIVTREVEMNYNSFTKNILLSLLNVTSCYIKISPTLNKNNCILSQETCCQVTPKFLCVERELLHHPGCFLSPKKYKALKQISVPKRWRLSCNILSLFIQNISQTTSKYKHFPALAAIGLLIESFGIKLFH